MSRPVGGVVASATLSIIVITAFTRVLGFAREQGLAMMFGAGPQADAFMVASTIPGMLFGTVAGAVGAAFLPVFTEYLSGDRREEAWELATGLLNAMLLASTALSALGMLLAPWLVTAIAPGFDVDTSYLSSRLLVMMFPTIVATGVFTVVAAILHTRRHFIVPALGPLVRNIILILAIYLLTADWGMTAVAGAMLAGAGVEILMVLTMASRNGLRHRWGIPWRHPGLLRVLTLSVPLMLGGLAGQAYLIIDRRLASALEPGSISALAFANRLVQLPLGLFVLAIATVLYPLFSEYASRRDHPALAHSIQFGLRLVAVITIPASVGLIVLREPIIRLLFQRGEFDARATQLTAVAVLCYGIGMLFVAANQVLVRGFHARQDMMTPLLIGGATFCVNVLSAFLLVRPLGHAGLALANSIGAISGSLLLLAGLGRALPLPYGRLLRSLAQLLLASLAMGGSAYLGYLGAQRVFGGRWSGLLEVGAGIGVGCLVYALILWRLRLPETQTVLALVRERTRRGSGRAGP